MINDQKILEDLKKMPAPLKAELLHYMEYLLNHHAHTKQHNKKPQFGSAKGFYKTRDDFDAPLEDFQDYMF